MVEVDDSYAALLRLVDTRDAGPGFPDLLGNPVRGDRLAELGVPDLGGRELAALRTLRDELARIALGAGGRLDRTATLNGLLRRYRLVPQLGVDRNVGYRSDRTGPVARLAERVLPQALHLLSSGDAARLAICASDDCAAPFLPARAGAVRSFCSPRCAGRERVRRHRAGTTATTTRPSRPRSATT